ncbi:putative pollen-specific leucine-rich repeat extensin-like protein 3 [Iris pallida]|uniref:Pollen-specific leucine-rich repeat extensin-like protein 3 n=1 Tax=Iris pallida TaxID=29817 RepID=A0AAX6ERM1_IRIPA|nr:putative pollen-specific leucine-rich repeat extensin-like protein 3 [Iris pallida]KAJ6806653.1 putative pollen-specific leucine-rich repeat extensin-like protein 3 [Iris pallida]
MRMVGEIGWARWWRTLSQGQSSRPRKTGRQGARGRCSHGWRLCPGVGSRGEKFRVRFRDYMFCETHDWTCSGWSDTEEEL